MKRVLFRAGSSVEMGVAHMMRCLTMADRLNEQGAACTFVCRGLSGARERWPASASGTSWSPWRHVPGESHLRGAGDVASSGFALDQARYRHDVWERTLASGSREDADRRPWPTEVRVDVGDVAEVMAEADLAIGDVGVTALERYCMEFKAAQMPFDLKSVNNTVSPEGGPNLHEGSW